MSNIIVQNLSWNLPTGEILLNNLSFALNTEKIGLIGKNGVGKTTLMRLLLNEIQPAHGAIHINCKLAYLPQNFTFAKNATIADILGITAKLRALDNIATGSVDPKDFEIVNEDWNLKERVILQLNKLGLENLELTRKMQTLSGGEVTRIVLANLLLQNPDYLLFDEPTNNLDHESREALYRLIKEFSGGILVISHDRKLLALVDQIMELSSLGLKFYGGNYDFYKEQKELEDTAIEQHLYDAKKDLKKVKMEIQKSQEKLQQREKQGNKLRKEGSQAKLLLDAMKERSEKTQEKLAIKAEKMRENAENKLSAIKSQKNEDKNLQINMLATNVPKNKMLLEIEHLYFSFPHALKPIIADFNLKLFGPKHLAISGKNGSGKTTLLRLIMQELLPTAGSIRIGIAKIAYLDQQAKLLDQNKTILENFKIANPDLTENDCYARLAQFLFRNESARKKVADLSGGEKLRAALACVLMAKNPPQLLLLDEPTNHMDLESITSIENALKKFQGAILVISHDATFLENIEIDESIKLE